MAGRGRFDPILGHFGCFELFWGSQTPNPGSEGPGGSKSGPWGPGPPPPASRGPGGGGTPPKSPQNRSQVDFSKEIALIRVRVHFLLQALDSFREFVCYHE